MAEFPIGTDITETDRFMQEQLEEDVFTLIEPIQDIVKSVLTTVGKGGEEDLSNMSVGDTPHKALQRLHSLIMNSAKSVILGPSCGRSRKN